MSAEQSYRAALEEVHEFQCGCDSPGDSAFCVGKPAASTFAVLADDSEPTDAPRFPALEKESELIEHGKIIASAWDQEEIETFQQCGEAAYADIRPLARGFNALNRRLARSEATWPLARQALLAVKDLSVEDAVKLVDDAREAGRQIGERHGADE